jgi:hypothetical protein
MEVQIDVLNQTKGVFVDTIIRYNEEGEIVEMVETEPKSNIITVPISTLMAGLIQGTYVGNFSFWAIGTGSQASSPNITSLVAEYNRKQVTIQFVDQNNAVSIVPTSRVVMAASWAKGELGVVTLSEFGIFSGTNANMANGGLMLDYVPHGPITLDTGTSLSRRIYFTF